MQINIIRILVGALFCFILGAVLGMYSMNYIVDKSNLSAYDAALVAANNALSNNQRNEAMGYLFGAIPRNPQRYAAYSMLGSIYAKNGEKEQAMNMYRLALEKIDKPQWSGIFGKLDEKVIAYDKQNIQTKIRELENPMR